MEAEKQQDTFLFLEERTWDVLFISSLLLIGLVGLWQLIISGEAQWLALIALVVGIARLIRHIRRRSAA